MSSITRREFVRNTVIAVAAAKISSGLSAASSVTEAPTPSAVLRPGIAPLRWLDGTALSPVGTTWGTPWPRGQHPAGTSFALRATSGDSIPLQSWPLAYWPDGSLKWTGHAIPASVSAEQSARGFELSAGTSAAPGHSLVVRETADHFEIDTGVILARVAKSGTNLIPVISRDGREILRDGHLVLQRAATTDGKIEHENFQGRITAVALESSGPVRAVIKISGRHAATSGPREWLPFVVRLYFMPAATRSVCFIQ